MRNQTATLLVLVAVAATAHAQVEAKPISEADAKQMAGTPHTEGPKEVPSPMLLEVKVSPTLFTSPAFAKQNPNIWQTRETAKFVCDKAIVRSIQLKHTLHRKDRVTLEITPQVATDWFRQDINLTVALLAPDGRELGKKTWQNLTIGNDAGSALVFGSRTKSPTLEIETTEPEFLALFQNELRPIVRVIVDVVKEDEDH